MPKKQLNPKESYSKINTFTAETIKRSSDRELHYGERYPYEIAVEFDSDITNGLKSSRIKKQRSYYGANIVTEPPALSFGKSMKKQAKNLITIFLLFSSVLMYFFNNDPFYLLIPLFIVIIMLTNGYMEHRAGKQFSKLYKLASPRVTVIRDGKPLVTDSRAIVAGDVIMLESGNIIPADARLIESNSFSVLETPVSGIKSPVQKDARFLAKTKLKQVSENMVYAGSIVKSGNATAIVCETGKNVMINKIKLKSDKANLPILLNRTLILGNVMSVMVVLLQLILIITGFLFGLPVSAIFMISLALGSVFLSDTLFALSSVALSNCIANALNEGAAIKNLDIIETLSSVDTVMCDKNTAFPPKKIKLDTIYVNLENFDALRDNKKNIAEILKLLVLCSSVKEKIKEGKKKKRIAFSDNYEGNTFTLSLLDTVNNLGITLENINKDFYRIETEFDSRGEISRVLGLMDGKTVVIVKGTPENVLSRCSGYRKDGINYKFNDKVMNSIHGAAFEISKTQVPVAVAFGYTAAESLRDISTERKLVFIGFVGFYASMEIDAASAVYKCGQAGIETVVSSEDSYYIAYNLAKNAGIIIAEEQLCTKEIFETTEEGLFIANSSRYKVFLNITDEDWLYIMRLRRQENRKIAVSVSRTEQMQLIKEADVSFVTASDTNDTVRHTSDVQMLDRGFDTVVSAMKNAKLAVKRLTVLNEYMPAGFLIMFFWIFISAVADRTIPVRIQDILLYGLFVNIMLMFSLAFMPSHRNILKESYYNGKKQKLYKSYIFTLVYSFFGSILCYVSSFIAEKNVAGTGLTSSLITFFALMVFYAMMCGLGKNIILNKIYTNYLFIGVIFISIAITSAVIFIPEAAAFFGYAQISPIQALTAVGIPFIYFLIIQIFMTIKNSTNKGEKSWTK